MDYDILLMLPVLIPPVWVSGIVHTRPLIGRLSLCSGMDSLLDLGVHPDHLLVQLRVLLDHDLGVPGRSHENGVDATGDWRGEHIGDLKPDEERKGDDDGREAAALVVRGVRDVEVDEGQQRAGITDERGAEGQHGADEASLYSVW